MGTGVGLPGVLGGAPVGGGAAGGVAGGVGGVAVSGRVALQGAPAARPPDLRDRVARRLLAGYRRIHRGTQPPLEISHDSERLRICPTCGSVPGSVISRSRARPRETWLFTVPTLHPSASAISA